MKKELIKLIKEDLVKMNTVFAQLSKIEDVFFGYFIVKNKLCIKDEIQAIKEISKPSKELNEYFKENNELIKKYCLINDDGTYKMINGNPLLIPKTSLEGEKSFSKLKKKYKEALDENDKKNEEIDKILKEEIEIKLYKINFNELPKEISGMYLEVLFPLIIEDE